MKGPTGPCILLLYLSAVLACRAIKSSKTPAVSYRNESFYSPENGEVRSVPYLVELAKHFSGCFLCVLTTF